MTDAPPTLARPAGDLTDDVATKAFSTSILISATRCLLTYVVFPWLLPLLGARGGVGPAIGLPIGVVAIGFNIASIRRFWAANHRWRWPITVLNCSVIVLLVVLVVDDLSELLS
jgi:hypothetical protein